MIFFSVDPPASNRKPTVRWHCMFKPFDPSAPPWPPLQWISFCRWRWTFETVPYHYRQDNHYTVLVIIWITFWHIKDSRVSRYRNYMDIMAKLTKTTFCTRTCKSKKFLGSKHLARGASVTKVTQVLARTVDLRWINKPGPNGGLSSLH